MQVCRLRPCEVFKQTGRELSFNKLCLILVFFNLHAGMQVTTLRSLQANRVVSYRLINRASLWCSFTSMQVCRLRPCEAFKQIDHELSFNKLCLTLVFFHLHAGMQVTTLRSLQANRVVSYRLLNCASLWCSFTSMQVCRLRPCEAFKQIGRELLFNKLCLTLGFFHLHAGMQVPLKMEPTKTTSSNHLCNGKFSFSY